MSSDPVSFPRQHARTRRFTVGVPRNITVHPRAARVLFLRSQGPEDPVLCLWSIDDSGAETLLVDPAQLATASGDLPPAELARRERARESGEGIVSFSLCEDGSLAAFTVAGGLFVLDLITSKVRSLDAAEGVFDPQIDPTGTWIAYVSDRALRLIPAHPSQGGDRVLVEETRATISWGRAEFIAAEEMGRSHGFWWAPDGSSLLAARVDEVLVPSWYIADPAHPDRKPQQIRYPAAGEANAKVGLALVTVDGAVTEVPWNPDGEFEYLADVRWDKGHRPLVVRQTRDQRRVSIATVEVDVARGSGFMVTERTPLIDDVWVELMPGSPAWAGQILLTIEDRDYLDRRVLCADSHPVPINDVHVRSIIASDADHVLFSAWTDPLDIHIGRFSIATREVEWLTTGEGVHAASAAVPNGTTVVSHSDELAPGSTTTVYWASGEQHQIRNLAATPSLSVRPTFTILGDRRLRSVLFLPENRDRNEVLPVLLDPYGGPHAQRVTRTHNPHLVSQWFANQGFAVLVTDGRGTPGRGPAFEREVWGNLADPVLEDQIDALDAAAGLFPFMDTTRVAIRGWSFGGYLAALALLRAPDRIHAAIAGAPVTSWHLYDTHYTERYLGHPAEHPAHYEVSDLIPDAPRLRSPLLLIHGLADDNVVAAHTLQFSSALLAGGRPHQVLPLSGVTHMTPQEVVAENLLHLQRDFLHQHITHRNAADITS